MGLKGIWNSAISILDDILTTKGDLISFSTLPLRVGVGANGTVLTADSAQTAGIKWATAGATVSIQESIVAADQTITADMPTYEDVTNMTLTMPSSGKALITACICVYSGTVSSDFHARFMDNAVGQEDAHIGLGAASSPIMMTITYVTTCAGQVVKVQASTEAVNAVITGTARKSWINSIEVA